MNPVEDQLRDALRAHAEDFTAHPDAWQQLHARSRAGGRSRLARTVARTRRRPGRPLGWSRFVVPAAAAAAVIAIIVGATALTGYRGSRSGSGTAPASRSASGAPAAPGRNDYLIQQDPPVSAIIAVKSTASGQTSWTFVWFGRTKDDPGSTELCTETTTVTKLTGSAATGVCEPAQIPAGHAEVLTDGDWVLSAGAASAQVASVSAQWPGGRSTGKLISGRGFPARVWLVGYALADNPMVTFRNAAGREVGKISITSNPVMTYPKSTGIAVAHYPADFNGPEPGTITAYLVGGRPYFWASRAFLAGVSIAQPSTQSGLSPFYISAMPSFTSKVVDYFGYAPQNVARVTLKLADGRQFSARTIAGWKGSGLRLWSFSVPDGLSSTVRYVALAYNAANRVVSQLTVSWRG
jgi:hypothetical protein